MNDDEPNTFLLDNDPARLLPYSKQMLPEDSRSHHAAKGVPAEPPCAFQRKLLMMLPRQNSALSSSQMDAWGIAAEGGY